MSEQGKWVTALEGIDTIFLFSDVAAGLDTHTEVLTNAAIGLNSLKHMTIDNLTHTLTPIVGVGIVASTKFTVRYWQDDPGGIEYKV